MYVLVMVTFCPEGETATVVLAVPAVKVVSSVTV